MAFLVYEIFELLIIILFVTSRRNNSCSDFVRDGSELIIAFAAEKAVEKMSMSSHFAANLNSKPPLCFKLLLEFEEKNSPGPLKSKSFSAIS